MEYKLRARNPKMDRVRFYMIWLLVIWFGLKKDEMITEVMDSTSQGRNYQVTPIKAQ